MRFACIEYTTKTGRIWRPTPERPNYLCDPEREIDPTSFGCYTSALNGEHLPLAGLIYGALERPPAAVRRLRQDVTKRFRGTFGPYALDYLRQFDVLLVIYQMSNDDELVRFMERARRELPQTLLVTSSSPPFGRLRDRWKTHPETADRYRGFIDASHFNMNVCRATVPWYRAFTDTPSLYLPQPYPIEYALSLTQGIGVAGDDRQHQNRPDAGSVPSPEGRRAPERARFGPAGTESEGDRRSERSSLGIASVPTAGWAERQASGRPIVYVAGDTVRPDILSGHLVAKVLQQRHPELQIRVTKTPGFSLNTSFLRGTRYDVVPFRPWAAQVRELASVRLVINTDLWWTRGRVPVDCAAAGVPCVGTTSDGQSELFPDLLVSDSTAMDELLERSERVLSDETFRTDVVAKAQRRARQYSYGTTVERFTHTIELARSGRLSEWKDPIWENDTLVIPS